MRRIFIASVLWLVCASMALAAVGDFRVGFAKRDITPRAPTPMWGYGARHDALSQGTLEPLMAKAIVIEAGDDALAIVGMDIGRGPTVAMMRQIREAVGKEGIATVLIAGSHTHHGPVLELTDQEGFGKGKYDDAVAYTKLLPELLIEAILEAKQHVEPARIGVAKKNVELNRNRHTKQTVRPVDPMLAVIRFDSADGKPLAVLANFAAHPVTLDESMLKFSPDYPGFLQKQVETAMNTNCVFMQGASGDMSPNRGNLDTKGYGEVLGDHVVSLAQSIETKQPDKPSIKAKTDRYKFASRVDFSNPIVGMTYGRAFFPELVNNFVRRVSRRRRARIDHRAAQRQPGDRHRLGRVLLQPLEPPEAAGLPARHAVLRLLQRPPHVLPHDRGGVRRRLRRRPVGFAGGDRRRRNDDGPGARQHLHDAGQIPAPDRKVDGRKLAAIARPDAKRWRSGKPCGRISRALGNRLNSNNHRGRQRPYAAG